MNRFTLQQISKKMTVVIKQANNKSFFFCLLQNAYRDDKATIASIIVRKKAIRKLYL